MTALHRTPGPWELIRFGGPQIGHRASGEAICTMWGSQEAPEDAFEGNVALITAAPDLLELAIRAETMLPMIGDQPAVQGLCADLRAAIAKATGA